jgi:hypothetical protein
MVGWRDVIVGAGKIRAGLQQMGIGGEVHIALMTPEDGERLERYYGNETVFSDLTQTSGTVMRTCTLSGMHFRWPKR